MRSTALPVAFLLLALLAFALPLGAGQAPGGAGVEYTLVVDCPETYQAAGLVPCPVRAVDEQDMMGDPSVAVDPFDPANLIIASLHGGVSGGGAAGTTGAAGCEPGPTPKSRCGQVFTTFTSTDHGASWIDNPFFPPEDVGPDAYGQHPQVTIDPYGHVYVGSLYAMPKGGSGYDYVIASQKFASLDTIDQEQDGEYHTQYLDPVYIGNTIGQMWFLFNPVTDNMTIVWNEQLSSVALNETEEQPDCLPLPPPAPCIPPPAGSGPPSARPSTSTDRGTGGEERLARTAWASEGGAGAAEEPTGKPKSVIGVVWSTSSTKSPYHYQKEEYAIGPCLGSTNPVLSEGWLYVGCVTNPSEGPFPWDPEGAPGTVEMFRMESSGGEPQYIGASPMVGGTPKLGVRSDGRLALVRAQGVDGQLGLDVAFGEYDGETGRVAWGNVAHHGSLVTKVDPAIRIMAANVQDVIYREHSGVLHLILKERVEPAGVGLGALQASLAPHIRKSIVAIDEEHGMLAKLPLDVGNLVNRTDATLLQAPEQAYDDLSDDFLQLPLQDEYRYTDLKQVEHVLGPAYAREFFSVGDYGTVIFAEVVEITNLRGPAALPQPPPPPAPAAAASSATTSVLVPAAGLTVTALIAASFIVNRRKDPNAAFAKHRK
ncbi:MAG TPA: hypothetical protein VM327_10095 [Candidatus Thermoplasmatota archaeon]|nr:hypothetical protein [Candidatus Thermoplasmatota archaeon]